MPGIAGIISRKPVAENARTVKAMLKTLRHEAFYVLGDFAVSQLGVCVGWVAQENFSVTKQIFHNESKDITLVFSGECFADAQTKIRLKQNGHMFSESGGDWLVHLYEERGEKFFEELNGIFSGLLIDRQRNKIFLFNDRYGLDRIYWHETADAFYFASEAKALLRIRPELRAFDRDGVAQFLGVSCATDGRTLFQGIRLLPGGSCWIFENADCQRKTYFSPEVWEQQSKLSATAYEASFAEIFQKILPRYFANESRAGIALTGGLDTRMFMACLPASMAKSPICYTFTGTSGKTMDDRVAARVAQACGLEHQLLRLHPDFFSDFSTHADKTIFVTDGSSGVCGAHEIYFNRQARELATMRLTGNYGGEILRNVSTFKPRQLAPEIFTADFLPLVQAAGRRLMAGKKNADTFAAFQEIPWCLFGNLAAGRSQIDFRTPYLDNELVALAYQCPAAIKQSALPATRFIKTHNPVLDKIPTDRGVAGDRSGPGIFLQRAFAEITFKLDYHSDAGLPRRLAALDPIFKPMVTGLGIAGLHKFLKYSTWFRESLAPYVRERWMNVRSLDCGFFNTEWIGGMVEHHIAGRKNFSAEINALLTLESVERQLFKNLSREIEID